VVGWFVGLGCVSRLVGRCVWLVGFHLVGVVGWLIVGWFAKLGRMLLCGWCGEVDCLGWA
jgi:hypothetical protein